MIKNMKDVCAGAVVAAIGVLMYSGSFGIKIMKLSNGSVSSAFMPRLCAVVLMLLGAGIVAINLIQSARAKKREQPAAGDVREKTDGGKVRGGIVRLAVVAGLLFLYCLFFNTLGFIVSSVLYLFATALVLSPRSHRKILPTAITAIVVPVAIYYVFAKAFYMLLPGGVLG